MTAGRNEGIIVCHCLSLRIYDLFMDRIVYYILIGSIIFSYHECPMLVSKIQVPQYKIRLGIILNYIAIKLNYRVTKRYIEYLWMLPMLCGLIIFRFKGRHHLACQS